MPEPANRTRPMMCSAASFHPDDARLKRCQELEQLPAAQQLAHYHLARAIGATHREHALLPNQFQSL
jgi:hypothetical protein